MRVKTSRIGADRLAFLREFGYTAGSVWENGEFEDLKATLLKIGGKAVILVYDDDTPNVMARGFAILNPTIKRVNGRPSRCHQNAVRFYKRKKNKAELMTGWALGHDGVWRLHSWLKEDETVVETVECAAAYFGFVMTAAEAELWCDSVVLW